MHNEVRVASISSYDCVDGIRAFVESALELDSDIASFLSERRVDRHVVIKPNWVQESHEHSPAVWEPVITHPNVVIAVVEALAERMGGQGTISVCDAPHTYASFPDILARGGLNRRLDAVRGNWSNLKLEILDLRREVWIRREEVVVERRPNGQDPRGYVRLDLGQHSLLYRHPGEGRYYGADYDTSVVREHHCGGRQEYLLSGTAIACDLFINLPKLKTHKKTGITCSLKNLVGINGDKNWLPHHTEGSPRDHGDESPDSGLTQSLERCLKRAGRGVALRVPYVGTWAYRKMRNTGKRVLGDSETVVRNGNWYGNDTCWRMVLDLNRCLLYGNPDGTWRETGDSKLYLAIVDGIVGGQGNGPLCPDPAPSGVLLAGCNPAVVDATASCLMGYDPYALPIVRHAFSPHRWPIADSSMEDIRVSDPSTEDRKTLKDLTPAVPGGFSPHFGWTALGGSHSR